MEPIHIFRHITCEGPGYLGEFLHRRGVPYRIVAIDQGESVPDDLRGISALVFMGGSMSVNDPLPWIEAELELIRQAQHRRLPVLGHCLGGQLIAKALGGEVRPNAVPEIGWFEVVRSGSPSSWTEGLPERFEAFHWHGETFTLPPGAVPLFRSAWCGNQAFAFGTMLALQFHLEMTADMVRDWADLYRGQLTSGTASVQSHEAMTTAAEERAARLNAVADVLYTRWLAQLKD